MIQNGLDPGKSFGPHHLFPVKTAVRLAELNMPLWGQLSQMMIKGHGLASPFIRIIVRSNFYFNKIFSFLSKSMILIIHSPPADTRTATIFSYLLQPGQGKISLNKTETILKAGFQM